MVERRKTDRRKNDRRQRQIWPPEILYLFDERRVDRRKDERRKDGDSSSATNGSNY